MNIGKLLLSSSNDSTFAKDYLITAIRIVAGIFFIQHGVGIFNPSSVEGFANWFGREFNAPYPMLMAYLRYGSEFFGGIMLLFGFFARLGALFIFLTMVVALLTAHVNDVMGEGELALIYAIVMVTVVISGSGKLSIDYLITKQLNLRS